MPSLIKSLLIILPRNDLLRLGVSSCLLISVAFAEVLGLAFISFLLINIQQPYDAIISLPVAPFAINYLNIAPQNVTYTFCFMVLAYSAGASLFSYVSIRSISVSSQLMGSRLRGRVLNYFLYSEWMEISKIQASDQISKLINDGRRVGFMISFCLHLFSRIALASLIIVSLLIFNFIVSLAIISILLGVYGLIFYILQPSIYKHGSDGAKHLANSLKVLTNIFGSLKEIIFYGAQEKFLNDYRETDSKLAWAEGYNVYLSQVPRFLIDGIILLLLVMGVIYIHSMGEGDLLFFGTLSVYGLAALKLLPALQNIYYFYHEIIASQVQLKSIVEISNLINDREAILSKKPEVLFKNTIEFKDISFQYHANGPLVLDKINISISHGKNVAMIGPSGSGKSTFIDLLLGLINPQQGEVIVDGVSISKNNKVKIKDTFAYVPQKVFLLEDTLEENILFGADESVRNQNALQNAINLSQLEGVIQKLPAGLNSVLSESNQLVSGGEKQLIGLARATLRGGSIIILDEATNAMDYDLEKTAIQGILRSSDFNTVICITHNPALLKYFDKIYVFDSGKISSSGTYDEVITDSNFLEAMAKNTSNAE